MRLIIRNKNIYCLGCVSGRFQRYQALYELEGCVGHSPGDHGRCHWMHVMIRNKNICGLGLRIWTVSEILGFFMKWMGRGMPVNNPRGPRSVSLDASYPTKQEYMWTRVGIWKVSVILGLLWSDGVWACSRRSLWNPLANLLSIISQTFTANRPVVTENSSRQNVGEFRHVSRGPFECNSELWNARAKLHIHIYLIPKFRIIRSEVTENSSGQNLGGKKKKKKRVNVEIDHEYSTVILSLPLIQEAQLSVSGEIMCTILVNRLED